MNIPEGARFAAVATNLEGHWRVLAYGQSELDATNNGTGAHRMIAAAGGVVRERKTVPVEDPLHVAAAARDIVKEWVGQQGHDRCWYYPELFRKLAALFGLENADRKLPPREEFKEGCHRYQREEYGEGN